MNEGKVIANSHVARGDAGDAKRPLAERMRPLARSGKKSRRCAAVNGKRIKRP